MSKAVMWGLGTWIMVVAFFCNDASGEFYKYIDKKRKGSFHG